METWLLLIVFVVSFNRTVVLGKTIGEIAGTLRDVSSSEPPLDADIIITVFLKFQET